MVKVRKLRTTLSLKTQVYFNNANIKGQFICIGAHLADKNDYALSMYSAKIEGGVFLHPRTDHDKEKVERPFIADGSITLNSSKIGGLYADHVSLNAAEAKDALTATNLEVTGPIQLSKSKINGEVRLAGSKIGGNLDFSGAELSNENGHALNAQRIKVDQRLIWKNVTIKQGAVSLNGAHVAELDDDPENWPSNADALLLDGFTYDRIRGKVSTSPDRDAWLKNGSLYKGQFFPQPYTQYAKFLRETGHDSQARKILLTRGTLVRKYERKEMHWLSVKDLGFLKRPWRGFWDRLQWIVVGHGHAPFWSIGWLALLIFLSTIPARRAWEEGFFAPNASPIIVSEDWQTLHISEPNPAKVWSGDLEPVNWRPNQNLTPWKILAPGRDWATFNRYAYAADIVIPLINFGQTDAWAPSTTRGDWGWHLWWLRWVFTVFGWIVTALGPAAITGIIRRD